MIKVLRLTAVTLSVFLLVCACGCGGKENAVKSVNTLNYGDMSFSSEEVADGTVCENATWRLDWDSEKKRVLFTDKSSGAVWGQTPEEADTVVYDESGMLKKNHPQTESAILVHYYDPSTLDEKIAISGTDALSYGMIYTEKISNGIKVTYDFAAQEMSVPVEYTIEEDGFRITIRPDEISDNGEFYVTGISVAPFMCGLKNNSEDSWLFLPDGSGAVIKPVETDLVGNSGSIGVYGEDLLVQTYDFTTVTQQAHFPVFGVKRLERALLGIIDSGAESASVSWNVGSQNIGYSSVYPFFRIRGYSLVEAPRGFYSPLSEIQVFAKYINTVPLSVKYYSLSGENADIYGMAKTYGEYLCETKDLEVSENDDGKIALKYIGAVVQPSFILGIPSSKLYSLTTTEQAIAMTREFNDLLQTDFYVDLVGFGASGTDAGKLAGGFTTGGSLGSKNGMKKLSEEMKKLKKEWYMDFDLLSFSSSGAGFSSSDDVAVLPNGQAAWFSSYNTVSRESNEDRYYLLKRSKFAEAADKLIDKAASMKLSGISLDSLSNTVYSDYNSPSMSAAAGFSTDAQQVFDTVKNGGYALLTDRANDYAAVKSDRIIDVPLYSSQYDISFTDVQFYGMVFKGYVPMNSVSINLCADENDALLRCIEAGVAPGFTLTYNYDNELITSQHSFIFGSSYEGNKQKISDIDKAVGDYYRSVDKAKILDYKLLSQTLRVTEFDNGVYAVVNYGSEDENTAYGTVPAHGWITGRR